MFFIINFLFLKIHVQVCSFPSSLAKSKPLSAFSQMDFRVAQSYMEMTQQLTEPS